MTMKEKNKIDNNSNLNDDLERGVSMDASHDTGHQAEYNPATANRIREILAQQAIVSEDGSIFIALEPNTEPVIDAKKNDVFAETGTRENNPKTTKAIKEYLESKKGSDKPNTKPKVRKNRRPTIAQQKANAAAHMKLHNERVIKQVIDPRY
jgi:hypothetical protein